MAVFAVQAEEVTKNVTFSDYTAGTQYAADEKHDLGDGLVIYTTECHFTTQLRIYSSSSHNGYVVSDALPGTITKMTFNAGNKVDKLDIYGSNDGTTWNLVGQVSVTSTSYNDYSFDFSGSYNRFKLDVNGANQIRIAKMSVTYTTGGEGGDTPDPVDVAEPTFTPADGETFEESLDVTINAEDGLTVYYSTDNVSYTEGNNVNITETTTVYAYAEDAEGNQSDVVSATYTKVDPNAKTAEVVSKDLGYENAADVTEIKIGDYITVTFKNGTSSNATKYYNTGYGIRNYNGNIITFTAAQGVTINSIVLTAAGTSYMATPSNLSSGTSTKEGVVTTISGVNSGELSYVQSSNTSRIQKFEVNYSIQEGVVVIATPSIAGGETFVGSTTVEITNNAEGTTLFYSTNGVNYNEYTDALNITETTTVYAYAQDGEGNKSSVAEATFTEMEILSIADAKAAYDAAGANVAVAMDITGAVVTVNSGQYMFIETAEAGINIYNSGAGYAVGTKFTTGYILGESAAYGNMHQITNAEFCNVATETVEVTPKDVTIAELNADFAAYEGRYVKLTGVDINDKAITQGDDTYALYERFDFITVPTVAANCDIVAVVARYNTTYQVFPVSISNTVDVTAAGYATLYLGYPVAIPAGVEAYVVSAVNDGWVALEQVTGVLPAETGVIVKADQGAYDFVYSAAEAATISSLLKGTVAATDITPAGTAYVLSAPDSKVGLYQATLTDGAFLNNANKAYLDVTNSNGIASYSFNFDWNGTTGVEDVEAEGAQDGAIYDITGRRVKAITAPGIYIVNGRKVVK